MTDLLPTGITANKKTKELRITWNDEHTSHYPLALLRYACPCAECRGGHDQMSAEPPREVFYLPIEYNPSTRLLNIEKAGTYGIMLLWRMGTSLGYPWQYLSIMPMPDLP
jgi:DUF971 family protein